MLNEQSKKLNQANSEDVKPKMIINFKYVRELIIILNGINMCRNLEAYVISKTLKSIYNIITNIMYLYISMRTSMVIE